MFPRQQRQSEGGLHVDPALTRPVAVGMKPDKSSGPDGIHPGVLKFLPAQWIVTITALLNGNFSSGYYPRVWRIARMFTVYKKGNKMLPQNYKGIGVISCLAKLFDLVLCARLIS